MCSYDDDGPSLFCPTAPRAKKQYTCCECGKPILAGETYARFFGVWDRDPETFRRHAECDFLCDLIEHFECGDEGTIPYGGLENEIENLEDGPYDEARDEYAPNWAAAALDAILATRTT